MSTATPPHVSAIRHVLANWGMPAGHGEPGASAPGSAAPPVRTAPANPPAVAARRSDLEPAGPPAGPAKLAVAPGRRQSVFSGQFSAGTSAAPVADNGPSAEPPLYLDLAEAAHRLSCTAETLRRHLRRGMIRGTKVGKEWRVSLAAIVAAGRAPSRPVAPRCA